MLSLFHYGFFSTICFSLVIIHAVIRYEHLFPIIAYLSSEKLPLAVTYNFVFMIYLYTAKLASRIFFGPLRDLEIEQLIESARAFILDTVLFLVLSSPTVEGEEVSTLILSYFLSLQVLLKAFHLIAQIRVLHMFSVGIPRTSVLVRLCVLLFGLLLIDVASVSLFYKRSSANSTFYVFVLFESLGMLTSCITALLKYSIHIFDLRFENGWPGKNAFLFYVDIVNDIASLCVFLIFMIIFFVNNPSRLPLYMTADILQVVRTLVTRLRSFSKYRLLTKNMNQRFLNATEEECRMADTCIICRDILRVGSKKLPCSHIFHCECLKSWFVQQQSCPTCRADIPPPDPVQNETANTTQSNETPVSEETMSRNDSKNEEKKNNDENNKKTKIENDEKVMNSEEIKSENGESDETNKNNEKLNLNENNEINNKLVNENYGNNNKLIYENYENNKQLNNEKNQNSFIQKTTDQTRELRHKFLDALEKKTQELTRGSTESYENICETTLSETALRTRPDKENVLEDKKCVENNDNTNEDKNNGELDGKIDEKIEQNDKIMIQNNGSRMEQNDEKLVEENKGNIMEENIETLIEENMMKKVEKNEEKLIEKNTGKNTEKVKKYTGKIKKTREKLKGNKEKIKENKEKIKENKEKIEEKKEKLIENKEQKKENKEQIKENKEKTIKEDESSENPIDEYGTKIREMIKEQKNLYIKEIKTDKNTPKLCDFHTNWVSALNLHIPDSIKNEDGKDESLIHAYREYYNAELARYLAALNVAEKEIENAKRFLREEKLRLFS